MSEPGPVLYDTVELRRRIAGAFSAGELRALAESLGVGGIAWDRGVQEAAREVVRQCERYAGLPSLVARLREERPLVEWPDPLPSGAAPAAPAAIPPTTVQPAVPDLARPPIPPTIPFAAVPALSSSPGSFGGPAAAPPPPAAPEAPLRDPYAPPPGPPVIQMPAANAGGTPAHAGSAPPPPAPRPAPPTAGWPGVVGQPAPPTSSGIDPRIFIAVAGLMVVAAVIAYLAGRASSASSGPEGSPSASASSPELPARADGQPHGDGPASHAAAVLGRGYESLARVCELPSSAGTSPAVFRRVFERCGPPTPSRRLPAPPPSAAGSGEPAAEPRPTADPRATADPAPRNKRPGSTRPDPGGGDPAPSGKGCVSTCDAQHTACRGHCGPEPTESGAYDTYQRCLGQCLRDASRCRLSCR